MAMKYKFNVGDEVRYVGDLDRYQIRNRFIIDIVNSRSEVDGVHRPYYSYEHNAWFSENELEEAPEDKECKHKNSDFTGCVGLCGKCGKFLNSGLPDSPSEEIEELKWHESPLPLEDGHYDGVEMGDKLNEVIRVINLINKDK